MLSGWREATARRPWRISAKLLIISSVVTVIGFSAICVNVMLDMRRGEEALARQTLENLATSIDADISRNIDIYDLSLKAVASNMLLPEINTVSKPIRQLILFDHATTAKHFGAIQVFDADGNLTIDASTLDPVPENRGSEDYFTVHRDNPNAGLFISRPMLFRGAYSIVLSRRVSDTDGGFMGVVAGSIRFTYFHELFERLSLDPEDTITVLKRDRTIMMRRPFDLDIIGRNLNDSQAWKADNLRAGGSFAGQGPVDPTAAALCAQQRHRPDVRGGGQAAQRGVRAVAEGSASHRRRGPGARTVRAGIDASCSPARSAAARMPKASSRRWRRRTRSRACATAASSIMSSTANGAAPCVRRRRSRCLMIDADHFKAYNDTFGHQAGDQVLVGIAICISDSVRRAGDCAARYGGEEFAVLLPNTSATDAFKIAETIRAKVLGWSDGGAGSTVSCGIASLVPTSGMDWAVLVAAADKALYAAKAGGRNQSVVASLPKLSLVA